MSLEVYIHPTAHIIDNNFGPGTKIWKNTFIKNSQTHSHVSIGDESRLEGCVLGDFVNIQRYNLIYNSELGRYSYTGRNFTCWHAKIGSFCSISWNVSIGGANHDYKRLTTSAFLYSDIFDLKGGDKHDIGYDRFDSDCTIGNDVWIGCGAVICRNVHIGDGAVIGANAVVTHDVEPYSIVAGCPARKIGYRFPEEIRAALLELKWWTLPSEIIKENFELFNSVPNADVLNYLQSLKNLCDKKKS